MAVQAAVVAAAMVALKGWVGEAAWATAMMAAVEAAAEGMVVEGMVVEAVVEVVMDAAAEKVGVGEGRSHTCEGTAGLPRPM